MRDGSPRFSGAAALAEATWRAWTESVSAPRALDVDFSCDCAAGDAPIARYRWEFGEDQIAIGASVTHSFTPGRRRVRLIVVDAPGLTAVDSVELR